MKEELQAAIDFICKRFFTFTVDSQIHLERVRQTLLDILQERYSGHWYSDKPLKGQAYRCIRLRKNEEHHDYIVDRLVKQLKTLNIDIESSLCKVDITLWIDPGEVSYR
jgi:protein Tob/BTG